MSDLATAISIAAEAHAGQVDKGGAPYILHPLRVMMAQTTDIARIVAVLHDVAEDFHEGWPRLLDANFADGILDAIDALARRDGEPYTDFIRRAAANDLARPIKIADIRDNLSPDRVAAISDSQIARYVRALIVLEAPDPQRNGGET